MFVVSADTGGYFVAILLLIPIQDFGSPRFCAKPLCAEAVCLARMLSEVHGLMDWKGRRCAAAGQRLLPQLETIRKWRNDYNETYSDNQ